MSSRRIGRLVFAISVAGVLGCGGPARVAAADASAVSTSLEEITVTARKQEESQQRAPVSVIALGAEDLEVRSVDSLEQVGAYAPNVHITPVATGLTGASNLANITIREVGQTEFFPSNDPAVGVYVDGVYLARTPGSLMSLVDIERVEILRGPQGTLFGKNTIGGAINIVSTPPMPERSGIASATFGEFNRLDGRLMLNGGLFDDAVAARLTLLSENRDGYGVRISDGAQQGNINRDSARLALAGSIGAATVNWTSDFTRARENSVSSTLRSVNPAHAALALYNAVVGTPLYGTTISPEMVTGDPYTNNGTGPMVSDLDVWGTGLIVDVPLTDRVDMKSISAFRKLAYEFGTDADNTPLPLIHTFANLSQDQVSQEFQLNGSSGQDGVKWVAGLLYFRERAQMPWANTVNGRIYEGLELLPAATIPLAPGTVCPAPAPARCLGGAGNPLNRTQDISLVGLLETDNQSTAAFGHASIRLLDNWSASLGLRYTYESKDYYTEQQLPASGQISIPPTNLDATWSDWSPKAGLEYQATDDVMLYGLVARAFKSGGFNGRATRAASVTAFNPEYLTSYEVGIKSEWLDRRLRVNADYFFNQYKDQQLTRTGFDVNGVLFATVDNVAEAESHGLEVDLTARPARGIDLSLGIGTVESTYTKVHPGALVTRATKVLYTPEWKGTAGAQWTTDAGALGTAHVRADYVYTGPSYVEVGVRQGGYGIVNVRLGLESADRRWAADLFATNLGDKRYLYFVRQLFGLDLAYYAPPREWGATLKYRF